MRVPKDEFAALDLDVHALLEGVPLHDVSAIDLPGGGPHRTIADVLRLMNLARGRHPPAVKALIAVRKWLGRALHWDAAEKPMPEYASRLTDEQRHRSKTQTGTVSGPLRVLYEFDNEMVGETKNATVHAWSCIALHKTPTGYRLYWAIYVKNVSLLTPLYMAAIEPFRRFLVYPSILNSVKDLWVA